MSALLAADPHASDSYTSFSTPEMDSLGRESAAKGVLPFPPPSPPPTLSLFSASDVEISESQNLEYEHVSN